MTRCLAEQPGIESASSVCCTMPDTQSIVHVQELLHRTPPLELRRVVIAVRERQLSRARFVPSSATEFRPGAMVGDGSYRGLRQHDDGGW
jgi:hypothetical protein